MQDNATAAPIGGFCEPRFARVETAFRENLIQRGDVGAAVAVTLAGKPVVDLWGGWLDERHERPWQSDSIVNVWSVGKAVAALCLLQQVERGRIELDAPVARYWPEFGQAGKDTLPVRFLLSHQAGLPAIAKPLPPGANLLSWETMTGALAEQPPWWEPGSRFGYHTNTFGFLVGELLRRVDGRRIGAYVREELGAAHGIDLLIGFGAEEDQRVAEWIPYRAEPGEVSQRPWLERDPATLSGVELARVLAYRNPPPHPDGGVNSRLWRAAEYPSTNPHSNARALARLFGGLACGGTIDRRPLLATEIIAQANTIQADGEDAILGRPNRFGLGFQLTIPGVRPLGPGPHAFGHYGNGAVLGFADPDAGLGFGFVCNRAGRSWRDPRNIALVDAVYASLDG
ncbi:MAG TPA: serine hydrolase domain-containing protein [Dehalococcoidia bacterium]|nr:serine hydrolase domain-containing protein [Dehalococcoidia bacterium]